ncbi:hypothetical protein [Spirosoma rhododendri]|uniref:Aerotolerance regulator N-terminal domain-containing protein n=1 Tax=Spirosoma rhododendri TaxID=2728024 RepID=A0A7L5DP07_9BACT|nr:hypothetical protein [Spirosoma rhododendri]QJD79815.1 hypothetical protein HH216_16380 [Spirosoma rhododendri]
MQLTLNWADPLTWFSLLALAVLLIVQGWLILRNTSLSATRKSVRLGLNGLLWLVLLAYLLQPRWPVAKPTTQVLLVGDDVPTSVARRVQDSLNLPDRFTSRTLTGSYDSVTLVGNRFRVATLARLSASALRQVPYSAPDELARLSWKAVLRQGEIQRVTGLVNASTAQPLRLRYGNKTLDSLNLPAGTQPFALQFPAFARGKSSVELVLGDNVLDTLRFFSRPIAPLTVHFLLTSPDVESKTLANWLGRQGHTVTVSATLSKDISSSVSINKPTTKAAKTPDLLITEPDNAGNPQIRKAVADGRAVLFINLTNPDVDSRTINQATGSRWQVRRTAADPQAPISNGLTALPYRFADNLSQFAVTGFPVFVQQTAGTTQAGRVGVSLLSETYPLALSGDSLTYARLWTAVLARLSGPQPDEVQVDAPLIQGFQQTVVINNPTRRLPTLRVGPDTLRLTDSPLNAQSASGRGLFSTAGWQPVQDSLALYVDPARPDDPLASRALTARFVLAHQQFQSTAVAPASPPAAQLPDWAWFALILLCFTALWLEPKLG